MNIVMTMVMAISFLTTKALLYFGVVENSTCTKIVEISSVLMMLPFFYRIIREHLRKIEDIRLQNTYTTKLNQTLINQSHNPLLYDGDLDEGAKILIRDVVEKLKTDRCSIWFYNDNKDSIELDLLYDISTKEFTSGVKLDYNDYSDYFNELINNPHIVANDAENHKGTSCFTESYLRPLGIKSMLDVPIISRGETIAVICIESRTYREWKEEEINFAEMISSLYSFSYSVYETKFTEEKLLDFERFVNETALVSKTDKNGKITYANKKFLDVCGYTEEEVIGKDHNVVNSGMHSREFWDNMYKTTVVDKKVWHHIVTNKNKKGELYYVDTYIKAQYDDEGRLEGFISIRQDITELYESLTEINEKNTYLEHAAKILRHDMHSGINTYIPRGVSSLERRLNPEIIKQLKLEAPMKMLKEGLAHAQRVYRGVYEFTNLVKQNSVLNKELCNIRQILLDHLGSTAYISQVAIDVLPTIEVNQPLLCTAFDNLIRNGIKYNDSEFKMVAIYMEDETTIAIQDNGRGMTQDDFNILSKPYARREGQKETGTGLGLNICVAILKEHGFGISCEKNETGTKIKIKIK
jgi:PAS domain S-box-containing protein